MPPVGDVEEGKENRLDVMFVLDDSGSMQNSDPNFILPDICADFMSKLGQGLDRAGAIKFGYDAGLLSPLTTDLDRVAAAIRTGLTYWESTNGAPGIAMALEQLKSSQAAYQYVIYMSDGQDYYPEKFPPVLQSAKAMGVPIFTIGLGDDVDAALLQSIASTTGGKYYFAQEAGNLGDAFDNIAGNTIDRTKDSDNDGVPDYYRDKIKSGELTTGTGSTPLKGVELGVDKNGNPTDDDDGDGLKNGEEIPIRALENGKPVYDWKSNPKKADTDGDGLTDKDDPKPLEWDMGARDLAIASALSYGLPVGSDVAKAFANDPEYAELAKEFEGWTVEDQLHIAHNGFDAMALKNGKEVIIAFRGTEITSFDDITTDLFDVGTGLGIQSPYARAYAKTIAARYPNAQIHLTGHSLGGYLAQHAGAELLQDGRYGQQVISVTTFNAPGIGWINSPLGYDVLKASGRVIHYETEGDVVSEINMKPGRVVIGKRSSLTGSAHTIKNFTDTLVQGTRTGN